MTFPNGRAVARGISAAALLAAFTCSASATTLTTYTISRDEGEFTVEGQTRADYRANFERDAASWAVARDATIAEGGDPYDLALCGNSIDRFYTDALWASGCYSDPDEMYEADLRQGHRLEWRTGNLVIETTYDSNYEHNHLFEFMCSDGQHDRSRQFSFLEPVFLSSIDLETHSSELGDLDIGSVIVYLADGTSRGFAVNATDDTTMEFASGMGAVKGLSLNAWYRTENYYYHMSWNNLVVSDTMIGSTIDTPPQVPLPASAPLMLAGLGGLLALGRRKTAHNGA